MTKKSTVRTIIIIVLCALILLPLFFGLLRAMTNGNGALSEFFAKANLDFWRVEYKYNIGSFNVDKDPDYFNAVANRQNTSYGLFSTMGITKASCDFLYAKGGVFGLATLTRVLVVITTIFAIGLIVIEVFRFFGKHFNVLENALSYVVLFLGIITTVISIFFFVGTTCKMLKSDYMEHSMKFVASLGWYLGTLLPILLGIFVISTKPYEIKTKDEE